MRNKSKIQENQFRALVRIVKSLRNNLQEINVEEISDAFMSVMDSMGYSREAKVNVLRTIKNKLQA